MFLNQKLESAYIAKQDMLFGLLHLLPEMQLFYGMILASYTMGKYMYNTKHKEYTNS